jgi:predicted RNA-binding Zn ribbon-like protein
MFDAAALDLINADEIDETWLCDQARRRHIAPDAPPSSSELAEVRRVRVLLRRLTEMVAAGRRLSERDLADVNGLLAGTPVTARLLRFPDSGYYIEMTPVAGRWVEAFVREVVGSWVALLRLDDPPRLRVCDNDACRRAFYDETRNRSRRWCDSRTCGNLIRVRRHRDARRAA